MTPKKHFICFFFGLVLGSVIIPLSYYSRNSMVMKIGTTSMPKTTIPTVLSESNDFLQTMRVIHRERKDTLMRTCTTLNTTCKGAGNTYFERAFFCPKYKLAACDIYKSGSSSMLSSFLGMNGVNFKQLDFSGLMRESAKLRFSALSNSEEKTKMWNSYLKVILVRDPFERYVSGYTDKLIPTGLGYTEHYSKWSKKMMNSSRHLRSDPTKRNQTKPEYATFEDFINYILTLKVPMDGHFADYVQLCEPCQHGYDVIMKMETLQNDARYVSSLMNLNDEHRELFFGKVSSRATKSSKTLEYFKTIPKELANKLYQNRIRDFEMFGYRKPEWLC